MERRIFLNFTIFTRHLHTSSKHLTKGRTLEPKPIPGSEEHLNPNAWAKRLFQLHEKRKQKPVNSTDAPFLHMICRLKPLKGVPYYERAILEKYGLGGGVKNFHWIVVENTPSVNAELNVVKHLIKVQPVLFPQGLPTDSDDLTACRLMPDGRFLKNHGSPIKAEIHSDTDENLSKLPAASANQIDDNPEKMFVHSESGNKGYLSRSYLRQFYNRQWDKFELFNEHFASHYRYKLNQDGSEYRYSRLWRLDSAMFHATRNQHNPDGTKKNPNQNRFESNWLTYPWSKF